MPRSKARVGGWLLVAAGVAVLALWVLSPFAAALSADGSAFRTASRIMIRLGMLGPLIAVCGFVVIAGSRRQKPQPIGSDSFMASLVYEGVAHGGRLYLTENGLSFMTSAMEAGMGFGDIAAEIPYNAITQVAILPKHFTAGSAVNGSMRRRLCVGTATQDYVFGMNGVKRAKAAIEAAVAQQ